MFVLHILTILHFQLNRCPSCAHQAEQLLLSAVTVWFSTWRLETPPPTPKSVPPQTPQLVISDTQHLPSYAAVATMKYRQTRDKLRRRELKESESGQDFFSPSVLLQGLRWLSVLLVACPSPLGASSVANIQHFVVTAKRNTLKKTTTTKTKQKHWLYKRVHQVKGPCQGPWWKALKVSNWILMSCQPHRDTSGH